MRLLFRPAALLPLAFAFFPALLCAAAQDKPADKPEPPPHARSFDPSISDCRNQPTRTQMTDCTYARAVTRIISLVNVTQPNDANEILVAVRNIADPSVKVYLLNSENEIVISTYPEEANRIEAFIKSLDVPHKLYRLTFTLADSDNGKRVGIQHFTIVAAAGERTSMKQGSKVPVATGSYDNGKSGAETQFTYLDVGMNFDVTATPMGNNIHLLAKVEQSAIAEDKTIMEVKEPVIRQSVLSGSAILTPGKPVALGQMDVPGTTRHLDIEVMAELVP